MNCSHSAMLSRHRKTGPASDVAKKQRTPMPAGYWIIWTTVALDLVGFGIVVPILGRYAERFGANGLQVGLMFASFSIAQMVFAPILGRISDKVGRKPVIVFSLIGTAVGSFVTGAAGALWVLFLGRILDGASGASVAVAQGAVADIAPPEQRARLMGMLGAAFGVGFVVGPALGGLAALGGPHVPFYLAGSIAAINAVAAMIRLPETKPDTSHITEKSQRGSALSPALKRFALVGFLSMLGFAGFEATFSIWGLKQFGFTEGSASLVFVFVGVTLVAVQGGLIGPLTERLGSRKLLRIGLSLVAAGLLLLGVTTTWPMLFVALFLLSIGQGVSGPSGGALVAELAPVERRGEAIGYQQSTAAFGRVAGPVMAGALFDHVGISSQFLVSGILIVLAVGSVWSITRTTITAAN
ncbi:MAG: MFS transporter [Ilumatobacteraceae bacterium]|nr:MFS transporter [Ilumatobacteraceae bacterium]